MSQYGAYGYALHGSRATPTILAHYYTGTALAQLRVQPRGARAAAGRPAVGRLRRRRRRRRAWPEHGARLQRARQRRPARAAQTTAASALGTTAGPLRVDAPVGQPLRLFGTSAPGVPDGLLPRLAARVSASGSRPRRRQRAGPRGLRARRGRRREPVRLARRGAARRRRSPPAPTRSPRTPAGATFDQYADTRSQMYRGVGGRDALDRRGRRRHARPGRHLPGPPGHHVLLLDLRRRDRERRELVHRRDARAVAEGRRRSVRRRVAASTAGARIRCTRAQVEAKLSGLVRGRFKRIKVTQRGVSPRVVRAQVVGTRGKVGVTGPQLRSRFGLFDSWAFFTTVTSKPKTPKPPATCRRRRRRRAA